MMNCVHCDSPVSTKDYWYYSEKLPIHTACIGYADDALLAKLFRTPLVTRGEGVEEANEQSEKVMGSLSKVLGG
jgi:hypothetical protein